MGRELVDLEPYISGKKKMMKKCDHKDCEENQDITKDYIHVETLNNKRRTEYEDFNPACDELVLFLGGWYCETHRWDTHWICKYCHDAKFKDNWDLSIHELICSNKPKDGENLWGWFRRIDWSNMKENNKRLFEMTENDKGELK